MKPDQSQDTHSMSDSFDNATDFSSSESTSFFSHAPSVSISSLSSPLSSPSALSSCISHTTRSTPSNSQIGPSRLPFEWEDKLIVYWRRMLCSDGRRIILRIIILSGLSSNVGNQTNWDRASHRPVLRIC